MKNGHALSTVPAEVSNKSDTRNPVRNLEICVRRNGGYTTIVQLVGVLDVADIVSHSSNRVLDLRISRRPLPSCCHFPR